MVEINITYEGQLRCHNVHGQSGTELYTDAPVDNHGRGESFSPTDLVATGLGSCMATIMGIVAQNKGIDIEGMKIQVAKHMSEDMPRRIARLAVKIEVPLPEGHEAQKVLENAALQCPVHQSIHPDIEVPIEWVWQG